MKTYLLLIVALTVFRSGNIQAADTGSLIDGIFNAGSRQERIEIAKALLQKIELFDSYVPNPSPSELSWLDKEQSEIDKIDKRTDTWIERLEKFHESPEFQQRKIKTLLNNTKTNIECIINNEGKLKFEILCWALISRTLSASSTISDAIMILKRYDRLPKYIELKTDSTSYYLYGLGIQDYIVIPYIAGNIK